MRLLFALLILLALTACQAPRAVRLNADSEAHQTQLATLQIWQISGRILYKDANEKHSAYISWQQNQDDFDMAITTLIGTRVMGLSQRQNLATLTLDDGEYQDTQTENLLWRLTGWHLPTSQLPQWLKGQFNGYAAPSFAPEGWLQSLTADNWQIQYSDYRIVDGVVLPHHITLQDNQRSIKIKISQWTLN